MWQGGGLTHRLQLGVFCYEKRGGVKVIKRSAMCDERRGDVAERVGPIYIAISEMVQAELTKV